jgi:hypothetical protein
MLYGSAYKIAFVFVRVLRKHPHDFVLPVASDCFHAKNFAPH